MRNASSLCGARWQKVLLTRSDRNRPRRSRHQALECIIATAINIELVLNDVSAAQRASFNAHLTQHAKWARIGPMTWRGTWEVAEGMSAGECAESDIQATAEAVGVPLPQVQASWVHDGVVWKLPRPGLSDAAE